MIVIYVKTSWLDEIPETRESVLYDQDEGAPIVALLAGTATPGFPFVRAELARRPADPENPFFLAYIPTDAVRGIFNLTAEQAAKAYGFVPPRARE